MASERDEQARAEFIEEQKGLDISKLVILDESSVNVNLTSRYGWGASNKRIRSVMPKRRGKNITLLATMSNKGMLVDSSVTFEGALNTATFEVYVREKLIPSLPVGSMVVLDNYVVHHVKIIKEAIEEAGMKLLFLPAYSPDLSPIELAFSKIKQDMRRRGIREKDKLAQGLEEALATISEQDAAAYFKHCGYIDPAAIEGQ